MYTDLFTLVNLSSLPYKYNMKKVVFRAFLLLISTNFGYIQIPDNFSNIVQKLTQV